MATHTLMVYSEAGGVTKTTTAVSLAMCAALDGHQVLLVDLDPRGATTEWLRLQPEQRGWHSGAILADDNAGEWVGDLVLPSSWSPRLSAIPSARTLSTREEGAGDQSDLRLRRALAGLPGQLDVDLIVLDLPNRQGGPITRNALNAADAVVYAATLSPDGVAGVDGARTSVGRFRAGRREIGAPEQVVDAGIVAGAWRNPQIPTRVDKAGLARLEDTGLLLKPVVPHRSIVQECRAAGEWYGNYAKGTPVMEAYAELTKQVLA